MNSEKDTNGVIIGIWCDVLGIEDAGNDTNFFELGGNSMLATLAADSIATQLSIPLNVHDMYEYPTLNELCSHVGRLLEG